MEHVVFFPGPDGVPVFRRLPSLDEAVAWVERLRNDEDLVEFSVHALTDVPLLIRTYYKVEVPAAADPADDEPTATAADDPPADPPAVEPAAVVPAQAGPPQVEADPAEKVPAVAGPAAPVEPGLGFFTS